MNQNLNQSLKKTRWTKKEDAIILSSILNDELISQIQFRLPNRTRKSIELRRYILRKEHAGKNILKNDRVKIIESKNKTIKQTKQKLLSLVKTSEDKVIIQLDTINIVITSSK